jgi:hypothetical protein
MCTIAEALAAELERARQAEKQAQEELKRLMNTVRFDWSRNCACMRAFPSLLLFCDSHCIITQPAPSEAGSRTPYGVTRYVSVDV